MGYLVIAVFHGGDGPAYVWCFPKPRIGIWLCWDGTLFSTGPYVLKIFLVA